MWIKVYLSIVTLLLSQGVLFASELVVTIAGVNNHNGRVFIAIYNEAEGFPQKGAEYMGLSVSPDISEVSFESIPPGRYSISVFHDENDDGVMNRNMFGVPVEGYGFSNNARGVFGPPDFEQTAFFVDNGKNYISINIKY